ncbi:Glucose-6-phosphate isomerase [Thermoplasmatales archaeon BRNA1]|nr:Glucose-6-phosphate isomerase [Thermoplasmatales archaeon BRNA1]
MQFETESLNRMGREVSGFVDYLTEALTVKTGITKTYKNVLICGMGASAIGGAVFADSTYYTSKVYVDVTKALSIPVWVTKEDTLFVACSYSGNTFETVKMYKLAVESGLDVIAVTHGGELESLSAQNGNLIVKIGGELMQPRSAIGWFVGLLGGIIEDAGVTGLRKQLEDMIPRLRAYQDEMEAEDSYARYVAKRIVGYVPVVYGSPDLSATAVRMKNQLNENSKIVAFSGTMPEFNHNEVVGWYEDPLRKNFLPIIINDDDLTDVRKIVKATISTLKSRGLDPIIVDVKGESVSERIIYAIMFGDYVSLFLAANRKVDPCNVDPIVDIKTRMKASLDQE